MNTSKNNLFSNLLTISVVIGLVVLNYQEKLRYNALVNYANELDSFASKTLARQKTKDSLIFKHNTSLGEHFIMQGRLLRSIKNNK